MISHDVLTKQWHLGLPSDCSKRCRLAEQSRILPGGGCVAYFAEAMIVIAVGCLDVGPLQKFFVFLTDV